MTIENVISEELGDVSERNIIVEYITIRHKYKVISIHRERRIDCSDNRFACRINEMFHEWHVWLMPYSGKITNCHWVSFERIKKEYQLVSSTPPRVIIRNYNRLKFL